MIAATNRPLEQMIQDGRFREDLFYRLNVVPIFLPALADRKNDIDTLITGFIKKFNKQHGKRVIGISPEAMNVLKKYSWPGNIRELENVIEHSFILENSNMLTIAAIPDNVLTATGTTLASHSSGIQNGAGATASRGLPGSELAGIDGDDGDLDEPLGGAGDELDEIGGEGVGAPVPFEMVSINGEVLDFNKHKEAFEREFIVKALKMFKGRINQTALHANIPKKTLLRKIEKYGIIARDYADK